MAVNTRTEYALRILIELAENAMMSAQKICEAQSLPKKYIEHLLSKLKNAGIIKSSAGSLGGYSLNQEPEMIYFSDILLAVEDSSFDPSCAPKSGRHCYGEGCKLSLFFDDLNDKLQEIFRSYSLADILKILHKG